MQTTGHVVGRAGLGIQVGDKPQALLGKRQRQPCGPRNGRDGRRTVLPGRGQGFDSLGLTLQGWLVEHAGQR